MAVRHRITLEVEGNEKPCLAGDSVTRRWAGSRAPVAGEQCVRTYLIIWIVVASNRSRDGAESKAVRSRARREAVEDAREPVCARPNSVRERWPFVARDREVGFLRESYSDPEVPGVVVSGGAGVGKSRLVRTALGQLESTDGALFAVATDSAAAIPFGCLAHLIPDASVAHLSDRFSFFNAVASSLAGSQERRTALVVDDAHLLDAAGAALVFHLANVRAAFVCAVVRIGDQVGETAEGDRSGSVGRHREERVAAVSSRAQRLAKGAGTCRRRRRR